MTYDQMSTPTSPVEPPSKMMPALIGGAIMGLISATPFLNFVNCLCCAGIIFGGFLAVFFYKDQLTPDMPPLQASDGVAIGALAGVFGFLIATVLNLIIYTVFGPVGAEATIRLMVQIFESAGVDIPPEQYDQMMEGVHASPLNPLSLFIGLFTSVVFGIIGGLIGSAIYKSKGPQIQQ
jgi:hypothetical protein